MIGARLGLCTALLFGLGCPSKSTTPAGKRQTVAAALPQVSSDELARELESTVLEILGQLTLGNVETYADSLRQGAPVSLIGSRNADTFVGDPTEIDGHRRWPLLELHPEFLSKNLDLRIAESGELAWTYDEVSLRVTVDGRVASLPIRTTLVFVRDVDRWVIAHDHWSFPPTTVEISRLASANKLEKPVELEPRRASPVAATLVDLVGRLENGDVRARAERLSRGPRAKVVLPGIDGEYYGSSIDSAPTLVELFSGARTVGIRSHRVESTSSGEAAWMTANIVVRGENNLEVGLRASYIFEHSESGWELVHTHYSVPLAEGILEEMLGIDRSDRDRGAPETAADDAAENAP